MSASTEALTKGYGTFGEGDIDTSPSVGQWWGGALAFTGSGRGEGLRALLS